MPVIVKQPAPDLPYSLHDAYILEVRLEGDTLRLVTQYGYVETTEPFDQVQGGCGDHWGRLGQLPRLCNGVPRRPLRKPRALYQPENGGGGFLKTYPSGDAGHYGRDLRVPPGEAGRLSQP